ncbi:MAG: hypothetical protein KTR22_12855 [Flavobacteriaceae bacterium]|nr:hypothetical protein [Flavobacteriaceae bacterium]
MGPYYTTIETKISSAKCGHKKHKWFDPKTKSAFIKPNYKLLNSFCLISGCKVPKCINGGNVIAGVIKVGKKYTFCNFGPVSVKVRFSGGPKKSISTHIIEPYSSGTFEAPKKSFAVTISIVGKKGMTFIYSNLWKGGTYCS